MRIVIILMLLITSINLTACSHISGNVVPESGPTMEQVYDKMQHENDKENAEHRLPHESSPNTDLEMTVIGNTFHKLPNPELKMYVFPHLAGEDEVPIPGYYTQFNAYTQDHFELPSETVRE